MWLIRDNRFGTDSERLIVAVERALEKTTEIERCETEAKKRFVTKHRQKEEQEPSTSPGKRKPGPAPVIVTLLALIIRERTIAGLKAARARGRKGGRPKKLQSKDLKTIKGAIKNQ
jgi:hypothetical protein